MLHASRASHQRRRIARRWAATLLARAGIAAVIVVLAVLLTSGLWAPLYNKHVHRLGRLGKTIALGDSCAAVQTRFEAYMKTASRDAQYQPPTDVWEIDAAGGRALGRVLSLYDLSPFDDVQLRVVCRPEDQVFAIYSVFD